MKRSFDILAAFILLLIFLIPMIILATLIGLKIGRPVFFTQTRPGLHEKPFLLLKFRSMTEERDENFELLPDEKRLTPFGRFLRKYSLDELPQLLNVLKGDISLVGPRPLLMEYLPLYSMQQKRRHEVKPGITGWAQINGRNAITWEEKFELDLWYIRNQSFGLDMKILFLTFLKALKSEGIQQEGFATAEKFKGSGLT
ncbi:sugar transferase [Bacillus sp. FJAT-42376]|uniref:sugar transferase n=1 Tax=Bacillus sp. FJAT-42376 TaxID=2014076 RepID=UPI000F4DF381|nr:sugar transferase [Bacillus sp. FJAT-42376]AZB43587.1 sugar transferase [Bacillus sp. FJAT-42376]